MKESSQLERTGEKLAYSEQLMHVLGISEKDKNTLVSMFKKYLAEIPRIAKDEDSLMREVRHFIRDKKTEVREEFAKSVLGQSGCFVFSIKSHLIADSLGVGSSLARSTGMRAIHVILVDKNGSPFDQRELEKGGIKPLSLDQIRAYGRYLQPFVGVANKIRDAKQQYHQEKKTREAAFIPCLEEAEVT